MEMKICGRCRENRPLQEFGSYYHNVAKKYYSGYLCRACRAKRIADYRKKNPAYREKLKVQQIARKYGLSEAEYQVLLIQQDYRCAICGTNQSKRCLHIDHNHSNGRVRSLLCSPCNTGLGFFQESVEILQNAIAYLRKHLD